MEANDDDNIYKWPAIGLTVRNIGVKILKQKSEDIAKALFETPVFVSVKYGTNVAIDTEGLMYGRNKTIPSKTKSYQKTSLDYVRKIDSNLVLNEILDVTGIKAETIEKFLVYGELMCNKGLFGYSQDKLDGTFPIFGAIFVAKNQKDHEEIYAKLKEFGFNAGVKLAYESEGSEDGNQGDSDSSFNDQLYISMNKNFKDILDKLKYPVVPALSVDGSFYDCVVSNYEWMVEGNGEGLIISSSMFGDKKVVSKWKIGAEANGSNLDALGEIQDLIEADTNHSMFGNYHEKAVDLFNKMLNVQRSSKKLTIEPPKQEKPPAKGGKKGQVELTAEVVALYEEPIKSAKSKFDHGDAYYAKGMKGGQDYWGLIAKECLNDIKIDSSDKKAMDNHNGIINAILKPEFIEFNKNKAQKSK